jgi:hypothetical protein
MPEQERHPMTAPAAQNERADNDKLEPLHPDATGFKLFRGLPDGTARDYTGVEFTRGWSGADQFRRQLLAVGYLKNPSTEPSFGVLDVLNAAGDIIQDYNVPTPKAFRYIKRKLKLRVETGLPDASPKDAKR